MPLLTTKPVAPPPMPTPMPPLPLPAASPSYAPDPASVFADREGRRWAIVVDLPALRRVHAMTGERMTAIMTGGRGSDALLSLISDEIRFSGVLWACLKPDAEAAGIGEEQFYGALRHQELRAAGPPFLEALADFFDYPLSSLLKRLAAVARQLLAQGQQVAQAAMDTLAQAEQASDTIDLPSPSPSLSDPSVASSPLPASATSTGGDSAT